MNKINKKAITSILISTIFMMIMGSIIYSGFLCPTEEKNEKESPKRSLTDDAWEENDNFTEAKYIDSYATNGLVQNDDDWYNFTASAGCTIIQISHSAPLGSLNLDVFDKNCTEVFPVIITEVGKITMRLSLTTPDIYYIKIWGTNAGWTYSIILDDYYWCEPDDNLEENDDAYHYKQINVGSYSNLVSRDTDCYGLWKSTYRQTKIVITFKPRHYFNLVQYNIFYGISYKAYDNSSDDGSLEILTEDEDGWIYFYVESNNSGLMYQMTITEQEADDSFEENDDYDTAALVVMQYYSDLRSMDKDCYKVALSNSQTVKIELQFNYGEFKIVHYIYNNEGKYWETKENIEGTPNFIDLVLTKADNGSEYLYFYVESPYIGFWYDMELSIVSKSSQSSTTKNIPVFPIEWIASTSILCILMIISQIHKSENHIFFISNE